MRGICLAALLLIAGCCFAQKADSVAEVYAGHSLKDLNLLSQKLTGSLKTDVEKFRAIYKWVCTNIEYDYSYASKIKSKRGNVSADELIRKLVTTRSTVCSGYAWLVRELSHKAGIPCVIVDGHSRSAGSNIGGTGRANHSWNAVLIDNQWRLCDPLWSAGYMSSPETFTTRFEESYFLPDPSVFILNHYPLKIEWSLLDNPPTLDQFLNGPLIYAEALRYRAIPIIPSLFKVFVAANESVSFSLHKPPGNDAVKFVVNGNDEDVTVKDHSCTVDHTFKRKGTYAVHFKVNDRYVATYEVTVR